MSASRALLRLQSAIAPRVALRASHPHLCRHLPVAFSPRCFRSFATAPATTSASSTSPAPLTRSEVESRVLEVVKKFEKVDASKVTPTAVFAADLGLDSLDAVELVMALEDEFELEINDADADRIQSTQDAINFIAQQKQAK